ncbi:MAG TPA: hypothetical protein VGK25_00035, partial [Ignavibacteria bacterium]
MVSIRRIVKRAGRTVVKTADKTVGRTGKKVIKTAGKTLSIANKTIVKNAEKTLSGAKRTISKSVKKGVVSGLDNLASGLAKKTGMTPLLTGVKKFSRIVDKSVSTVLKFAKCAKWVKLPVFWAITGVLYA